MPGLFHLCPANEETTIKVELQSVLIPIPTSSPTVGPTAPMSTLGSFFASSSLFIAGIVVVLVIGFVLLRRRRKHAG
jgi:LPXTG-motif cell wall-anchored protein